MNNFEKELRKASSNEKIILQCLSLFFEQITAQELYQLLKLLELKTPEGRSYSAQYISLLRSSFIRKGFVENTKEYWGSGFQLVSNEFKEFLTREAQKETWFDEAVDLILTNFPLGQFSVMYDNYRYKSRLLRDYRLAIYQNKTEDIAILSQEIIKKDAVAESRQILTNIFWKPFQSELLDKFETDFQTDLIPRLLENAIKNYESTAELWDFVHERNLQNSPIIKSLKAEDSIFRGEFAEAAKLIDQPKNYGEILAIAILSFLEKDYQKSVFFFEETIKLWKQIFNKKKGFPSEWEFFFYGLALYKTDENKFHKFAEEYSVFSLKHYPHISFHRGISAISYFLKNNDNLAGIAYSQIIGKDFYTQFIRTLTASIVPIIKPSIDAEGFAKNCLELGYEWAYLETLNLLKNKGKSGFDEEFERIKNKLNFEPIGNFIPKVEEWERALNTLEMIAQKGVPKEDSKTNIDEIRVAWLLDFEKKEIQPVEQKYGKKGWTDGRNIALKRLKDLDVKSLTEQDRDIVRRSLKTYSSYYYGGYDYDFLWEEAVSRLVGHPYLFSKKNPTVSLTLTDSEPNLVIREIGEELELSFDQRFDDTGIKVEKETENRYKVIKINQNHVEISRSLRNSKLRIPSSGREKLLKVIQPLTTQISIQSDLEEHFENLPSVEADMRIHALFTPSGENYHLEFFVKPFDKIPPYFKPGKGTESLIADLDGVKTRTKRDLKSERKSLAEIEEICPFLAKFESPNYEWTLENNEDCLTALSELEKPRNDGKLVVEWTKGQKLKLLGNINFENFSMSVKGSNDWFEIDGKVKVNEDLVLSMRELSNLLSTENTNFIELSDGQFIAITEKLRKHLQSLNAVLDDNSRMHNLRSGILEDLAAELENFKADKAWKEHLEKIKEAQKFVPELPKTFDAELRPYQIEGYEWLSRLANWGVGACLADDMGLGKTLQALALLVERAEKGTALVVAPVSVCRNWLKEAQKFAPTLNFHLFGKGERQSQLENLGKYDVLVVSYNLLQIEEELFTKHKFATIVLDEAQAVKNRATKRSKTVMNLQGDFRMITTGTPIENHLGELWNLFNFINPAMLGSYDFFNEKFAAPIERTKDENARKTLQRLIKPFVLRRRKNQVLDDLPEKTEIVLTVEMSAEERAFYESVRREALEKIESEAGEAKDKRFRILAELTRLRLACCHPKLVNANVPLSSSKLELFGETLDELLENRHKALVFSQFVKHLAIIEDYLKSKGIAYHYLDGSTPAEIRQQRIDAFQRGSGDVFLISLKAGGTGLNLTAADYVIHLDPWWNPAVEDQASDRAHRIGQQRPVTVYRLVTEDTVEEKILKLHEIKRDLADSLLDGTDTSGRLSAEDLLALISEG